MSHFHRRLIRVKAIHRGNSDAWVIPLHYPRHLRMKDSVSVTIWSFDKAGAHAELTANASAYKLDRITLNGRPIEIIGEMDCTLNDDKGWSGAHEFTWNP